MLTGSRSIGTLLMIELGIPKGKTKLRRAANREVKLNQYVRLKIMKSANKTTIKDISHFQASEPPN